MVADVLDYLGVVVGRHKRLALAVLGHRQPADEVRQPGERRALAVRVLMQVVVELPRLVADPKVIRRLADDVVEDHVVRGQNLVHTPQRLEALQVVPGGLRFDMGRLVGQMLTRWMDALALRLQHGRHRVLGEPVDLQARDQGPQLACDRDVPAHVAEADGRGDEQRSGPDIGAINRGVPIKGGVDKLADREVHLNRMPRLRDVVAALNRHELCARRLRQRPGVGVRGHLVLRPADDEHGALHAAGKRQLVAAGDRRGRFGEHGQGQRVRVGLQAPFDDVVEALGRMGLVRRHGGEPLDEITEIATKVQGVELRPAARRDRFALEPRLHPRMGHDPVAQAAKRAAGGEPRADQDKAEHPLGVLGGEQEGALGAARETDDDRLLGPGRVKDVEGVLGELRLGICLDGAGPVALAVAARVEDDHAVMTGEVGDLHLPHPRVHERPGGAKQDRRLAVAVDLIEDADAVALDVAVLVRIPRSGLLACISLLAGDLLGDAHPVSLLDDLSGVCLAI